jgi:hypothetical protein
MLRATQQQQAVANISFFIHQKAEHETGMKIKRKNVKQLAFNVLDKYSFR